MKNLSRLITGELQRLISYKILPVSLATSVIWIIIFLFISKEEARSFAPLLIFVDVAMMSVLLIGASMHLEKQEGTLKTIMVLPAALGHILLAKVTASLFLGVESVIVTSAALFIIHGVTFNYALLLLFVLIAAAAHAAIGFFLALVSKDFTSMLSLLMAYLLPFTIPSVLFSFGIIDAQYDWLLMLSPSHSAQTLIASAVSGELNAFKLTAGCIYLTALALMLFKFLVFPKFKRHAVRG